MRAALLAAALIATPAAAFDLQPTVDLLTDANYTCVSGENHDGEPVGDEEIKRACLDTVRYIRTLKDNGWCTDENRQEWFRCE